MSLPTESADGDLFSRSAAAQKKGVPRALLLYHVFPQNTSVVREKKHRALNFVRIADNGARIGARIVQDYPSGRGERLCLSDPFESAVRGVAF
jgi:hypothetical protein